MKRLAFCFSALAVLALATTTQAVTIDTVPVGNPGNPGELSGHGIGVEAICGAVDYTYDIGKYEVTNAQYTEFLNAVAGVDTYRLYWVVMWDWEAGCKIERFDGTGTLADPYQYRVAPDRANRPVNNISWGDAARFSNWLHNGQPTGLQNDSTTEDGSYDLNGATSNVELMAITRRSDATWVIPTENEWYKAAYHKNDGVTGNYFNYSTSSDSVPSNDLIDPDPGNNANYVDGGYTLGSPYYMTEVGEFENSASPYGTFDQSGNLFELNETKLNDSERGMRGGYWANSDTNLRAPNRFDTTPTNQDHKLGFRVASVPERPFPFSLDIKPGSDENPLNLKSKGVLPVSILTTDEFDALSVDLDTLLFGDPLLIDKGAMGVSPIRFNENDVNDDGLMDLILFFSMSELVGSGALDSTSAEVFLMGAMTDGSEIIGSDMVRITSGGMKTKSGGFDELGELVGSILPIPEPVSLALLCMGAFGFLAYGWRRRTA